MAAKTSTKTAGIIAIVVVLAVTLTAVAATANLFSDGNEATELCLMALEEDKLRALKDGDQPNLSVKDTPEGKKITKTHPTFLCESVCSGTIGDTAFTGSLNHRCFGLSLSTTNLEIGFKKKK